VIHWQLAKDDTTRGAERRRKRKLKLKATYIWQMAAKWGRYPLDFINHRAPKMVVFWHSIEKCFALQSSSRFRARREASESAKQIEFG
jgi:hypothetical protein